MKNKRLVPVSCGQMSWMERSSFSADEQWCDCPTISPSFLPISFSPRLGDLCDKSSSHTHTHTHTRTQRHMFKHTDAHSHTHRQRHTHKHRGTHTHTQTKTQTQRHTQMHTREHSDIHWGLLHLALKCILGDLIAIGQCLAT